MSECAFWMLTCGKARHGCIQNIRRSPFLLQIAVQQLVDSAKACEAERIQPQVVEDVDHQQPAPEGVGSTDHNQRFGGPSAQRLGWIKMIVKRGSFSHDVLTMWVWRDACATCTRSTTASTYLPLILSCHPKHVPMKPPQQRPTAAPVFDGDMQTFHVMAIHQALQTTNFPRW